MSAAGTVLAAEHSCIMMLFMLLKGHIASDYFGCTVQRRVSQATSQVIKLQAGYGAFEHVLDNLNESWADAACPHALVLTSKELEYGGNDHR
jgi:hypothetical protein